MKYYYRLFTDTFLYNLNGWLELSNVSAKEQVEIMNLELWLSDQRTIEKSKKMLGQMESVLGADSTIKSLVDDIVQHYESGRANLLTGKSMIVAYSAIAAYLLKQQGYDVTCAFMRNWDATTNNDFLGNPTINDDVCPQEKDYQDAMKKLIDAKIFDAYKDILMISAIIGYNLNLYVPIKKNASDGVLMQFFSQNDYDIMDLLAFSKTKSQIVIKSDEKYEIFSASHPAAGNSDAPSCPKHRH